ncbi:hypothetical protein HD806DRAFT_204458 [Xylariaceae sp. AK1471]|nr:hypothetical protein HD806DRAFT_204458 [Xylariaceae sp. AK1471]
MAESNAVAIPRNKHAKSVHPTSSATDETRWRLVLAHTPTTDFLYGVLSTGIFCRTSCPSRRPRRANVRFFDSAASAAAAGFRACRRCRPTDSSHESSAEKQVEIACEYVRQRRGDVQLLDLAAHVGLSPRYFHGLFKQVMGTTPGAYAATVRQGNTGQSSVATTPVAAISYPTPNVVDFGNTTDLVHFAPVDSSADFDPTTCSWLPDAFDSDPGCISLGENQSLEWLNDCDLDADQFSGTNIEFIEPREDSHSSDYVDPSVLNLLSPAT